MNNPVRIAHAYGNSRASLRRALVAPIDVIEADVWYRGGEIDVRHEPRLGPLPLLFDRRMQGHPLPPKSLRLWHDYYVRLDINSLKLDELLEIVGGRRRLLLDVKGDYRPSQSAAFASVLVGKISEHGAADWVSVCGQFWPVLHRVRELTPDIEVSYSIENPVQWERFVAMLGRGDTARNICIEHRFLSDGKARFLQEHEVEAYCWTVDDSAAASRLIRMGVGGIISNDLALLRAITD
jgi:glycerophosphoryl diester phosphodiesterase